jgi:hypothetical protein
MVNEQRVKRSGGTESKWEEDTKELRRRQSLWGVKKRRGTDIHCGGREAPRNRQHERKW